MRVQKGGGKTQISRCANVRMSRCADEKKRNFTSKAQMVRIRLSNSLIVLIEAYSVFHPHIRTFTHPHICKFAHPQIKTGIDIPLQPSQGKPLRY